MRDGYTIDVIPEVGGTRRRDPKRSVCYNSQRCFGEFRQSDGGGGTVWRCGGLVLRGGLW